MTTRAPNRGVTARGFAVYDEFTDTYGNEVRVQLSSACARAHVWIFCKDAGDGESVPVHLDVGGARRLRDALNEFIRENK